MLPQKAMYGPAPARPRKTNIVRSRTGCKPCRRRRKKCDERQPCCSRCEDSGKQCWYEDAFEFRDANQWAALQVKKVRGDRLDIDSASTPRHERSPSEINWPSDQDPGLRWQHVNDQPTPSITPSPKPKAVEQLPISPAVDTVDVSVLSGYESPTALSSRSGSALYDQEAFFSPEEWDFGCQASSKAFTVRQGPAELGQHLGPSRYGSLSPTPELPSPYNLFDDTAWEETSQDAALVPSKSWRRVSWQGSLQATLQAREQQRLFGSLSPSLPCPDISATDHKYLTHFVNHVVSIIPVNKDTMLSFISGSSLALQAAMAIGAANLANLQGRYSFDLQFSDDYTWLPDRSHRISALDYAGKALSMATQRRAAGIGTLIASHLMLSFVELELGTFEGLRRYLASVDGLVYKNHEELLDSDRGRKMLRSLANTRSMQRYLAGPMGPQSRESQMDLFWQRLGSQVSPGDYDIQKISYSISATLERLSLLTTMRHCRTTPTYLGSVVAKHLQMFTNSGYIIRDGMKASEADIDAACVECLAEMRSLSDEILSLTPPEGLPLPEDDETSHGFATYSEPQGLSEDIEPIYFGSHEEAMRAADYAFCRIMCAESTVLGIIEGEAYVAPSAMRWLELLVRVALGLDLYDCVNRNIYRRGICGMLLHSAIRCLSPRVCGILEDLLDRLILKGCIWEDTTFPSILSVSTVRAVRDQLLKRRGVLFISTVKQDFNAKFTIMSNRMTRTLLIHGWEADGGVFDESLPLNDFVTALGK